MRIASSIHRRCEHCRIVRRHGKALVVCKRNPRHKQRQR